MTTVIRLVDEGQDYITFYIEAGLIVRCLPNDKQGWVGTIVRSKELIPGKALWIELHNGYDFKLQYLIVSVHTH